MGAGLVEQGEVAPHAVGLALGDVPAGDVGHLPGDAHRLPAGAVEAVQRDRPEPVALDRDAVHPQVEHRLAAIQHLAQRDGQPVRLGGREEVVRAEARQVGRCQADPGGEGVVDALEAQPLVEQDEAGRGLPEDGLGGGQVGLDPAQPAEVDGQTGRAGGRECAVGHQVELGEALGAGGVAVGGGADPLLAGEDALQPGAAALPELARHEGGDRVGADRLAGGQAEELRGAVAPLADPAVRADREGGDADVVVDRAGLPVAPPGTLPRRRPGQAGGGGLSGHGDMTAAARRTPRRGAVQRTDPSNPRPSGCREDRVFIIQG